VVGTYVVPEVFPELGEVFAPGATVIHVDLDPGAIAKNHRVDLGAVADPRLTLGRLADHLQPLLTGAALAAADRRRASISTATLERRMADLDRDRERMDRTPLEFAAFAAELARQAPDDVVLWDEALTCSPDLTRHLPPTREGHFFQTRGGSLGTGFPGAIGAKVAMPDRTVIGFSGDGGSMYTIQALWTAAHHGIGAKFVVCNNHSYKLLKLNVQQYWKSLGLPERDFPASFDITDPDIRFADQAAALGVPGERVESPGQIAPAIARMLAHDGPYLIDLVVSDQVPDHVVHHGIGQ